ncbi:unnamed protein product [Microthlaspi erraticum]|uniref:Uncharacterized protein n=1 Tax=Microthlaspi erraticum TaxID=1685480 RepID=A0A6D2IY70_9BRAS|nr:unnamed protein product [Microthlaspi erraticum]
MDIFPKLFVAHCKDVEIVFSQLCPATVRNVMGTLFLAAELDMEIVLLSGMFLLEISSTTLNGFPSTGEESGTILSRRRSDGSGLVSKQLKKQRPSIWMGKLNLTLPRYGKGVPTAVVPSKGAEKKTEKKKDKSAGKKTEKRKERMASASSARTVVTIGDHLSGDHVVHSADGCFIGNPTYTWTNPKMGLNELITPTWEETNEEGDQSDRPTSTGGPVFQTMQLQHVIHFIYKLKPFLKTSVILFQILMILFQTLIYDPKQFLLFRHTA